MTQLLIGVFWFVSVTGGEVQLQKAGPFPLVQWENGDQLFWRGGKVGDRMELATEVEDDGTYRLRVVLTKAPDYGIVQFELDGKKVGGRIDLYSTWVGTTPPIPLGDVELKKGKHTLGATILGKNDASKGMYFGIDRVLLTKKPEASSEPPQDATGQLEELSKLELLPETRTGQRSIMFSSYDRTGGNNDGFGGNYSKLWIEDGNAVLAVMDGPGVVERIWFTHSGGPPGLLGRKGEHIRFYLDGSNEPAIDVPLEELFSGRLPQFPAPLVGESQGGFYCYVPIPYRDGCKIEVDGTAVRFYQITYTKLPTADGISSFSMKMGPKQKATLAEAVRLWSDLGDPSALNLTDPQWTEVDLAIEPGQTHKIVLPEGARMVRAVLLEGDKEQLGAARNARLRFTWDGEATPAVDLPAEFFFCQALGKKDCRSLLAGTGEGGWYNFMPMPYHRSASLEVKAADKPVSGKLRIATVSIPTGTDLAELGRLHSAFNEALPAKAGVHHQFLKQTGKGHYAGVYMVTQWKGYGRKRLPLWLEGDEIFTVDGSLDIHGTGSEDYFSCGYYSLPGRLNGPGGTALHGFPVFRTEENGDSLATAYRWHIGDPVPYEKEIDAKIEHGATNNIEANYRSATFYYVP